MATRIAVTKCLNLVSIKALTTGGKFMWSAKTWAYMSHANGPWYTLGPLFVAGLAATSVISILPAAVVDPGHYVDLQVAPDPLTREVACSSGGLIMPTTWCTGSHLAVLLLQVNSIEDNGYALSPRGPELILDSQLTSNRSLGYPWQLVNNNLAEIEKYNVPLNSSLQLSNKTACAWVLDRNPMTCSFLNYTTNGSEPEIRSPLTDEVYVFSSSSSLPQAIQTREVGNGIFEMAVIGSYYQGGYDAFVCTTRELTLVHTGRYIAAEPGTIVTYVDVANDTSCQPTYDLPSNTVLYALLNDMAGGLYQFTSVDGSNNLIDSFSESAYALGRPMFPDSTNLLEDGMGAFMALSLSHASSPRLENP